MQKNGQIPLGMSDISAVKTMAELARHRFFLKMTNKIFIKTIPYLAALCFKFSQEFMGYSISNSSMELCSTACE